MTILEPSQVAVNADSVTTARPLLLKSTLEESVLAGFEEVGRIGVSYSYKFGELLPLSWRVRVLTEDGVFLPEAPYSLSRLSSCCGRILQESEEVDSMFVCGGCELEQHWATTSEPLSILGRRRDYSLERLEAAVGGLFHLNPLEAVLVVQDLVEDIERVHREYMTPEWAEWASEQILSVHWSSRKPPLLTHGLRLAGADTTCLDKHTFS